MKYFWVAGVITVSSITLGVTTNAHENATGVVKERMGLMKGLGKSMKALARMIRGGDPYDADKVKVLAKQLGDHGSITLTKLFPEGSLQKPTEARLEIWENWERFSALAEQLTDYAKALEEAADNEMGMSRSGVDRSIMGQGSGRAMGSGRGPIMPGNTKGPSPEHLTEMSPKVAFMRIARNCSGCHRVFRQEK